MKNVHVVFICISALVLTACSFSEERFKAMLGVRDYAPPCYSSEIYYNSRIVGMCRRLKSIRSPDKNYVAYVDTAAAPKLELLAEEEEPTIVVVDDFDTDSKAWLSQRYIPVGVSITHVPKETTRNIIKQAKQVKSTLVLLKSELVYKWTEVVVLAPYYYKEKPLAPTERHYRQNAVYFVKTNQKFKFGVNLVDLTIDQRKQLDLKKGAVINAVLENSAAARSSLESGDVLLALDNVPVNSATHALKLMRQFDSEEYSTLTIMRGKEQKKVTLNLSGN